MDIKELFSNMSEDIKEKAKNCKTRGELLKLVQEENIELSPEQVEAISGGKGCGCNCVDDYYCPVHFNCMKVG